MSYRIAKFVILVMMFSCLDYSQNQYLKDPIKAASVKKRNKRQVTRANFASITTVVESWGKFPETLNLL